MAAAHAMTTYADFLRLAGLQPLEPEQLQELLLRNLEQSAAWGYHRPRLFQDEAWQAEARKAEASAESRDRVEELVMRHGIDD